MCWSWPPAPTSENSEALCMSCPIYGVILHKTKQRHCPFRLWTDSLQLSLLLSINFPYATKLFYNFLLLKIMFLIPQPSLATNLIFLFSLATKLLWQTSQIFLYSQFPLTPLRSSLSTYHSTETTLAELTDNHHRARSIPHRLPEQCHLTHVTLCKALSLHLASSTFLGLENNNNKTSLNDQPLSTLVTGACCVPSHTEQTPATLLNLLSLSRTPFSM